MSLAIPFVPVQASLSRITINHRCEMILEDGWLTISVDGRTVFSLDEKDALCRRLVMAMLSDSGVAQREQVAHAFDVSVPTVDRCLKAYRSGGVQALILEKRGPKGSRADAGRDKVILATKRAGQSNVAIARKLGTSEKTIRKALLRLGYTNPAQSELDGLEQTNRSTTQPDSLPPSVDQQIGLDKAAASGSVVEQDVATPDVDHVIESPIQTVSAVHNILDIPEQFTADTDPSNRSLDRLLATEGLLQDAAPLFEDALGVREVGALLAIPILTQQGIFSDAMRVFGSIGPAFYGLRTTVVCLCLMMVLHLSRAQHVMGREPGQLGRLLGLDRSPEVKTLRRKINILAAQGKSLELMEAWAKRRLTTENGQIWVYLDGHVSVYSGGQQLREHHVTQLRAARPSVMDYWVNQPNGEPLMVVTSPEQEGLVRQVPQVIAKLQTIAPGHTLSVVFDREGWSPKMFAQIKDMQGVHFLTYRKATAKKKLENLPSNRFSTHVLQVHSRPVSYDLADTQVRIPYLQGRTTRSVQLRQITRRKENGKQTHILTDDMNTSPAELAQKMFGRWAQENFFKYASEHRGIDALVCHKMAPADGHRMVPNPLRKKLKARNDSLKLKLRQAHEQLGRLKLELPQGQPLDDSPVACRVVAIQKLLDRVRQQLLRIPAKVSLKSTDKGKTAVQPRQEHRRIMHVFRICAESAEASLLDLLRPNFPDWRHEGRALVRSILHSSGNIRVTATHLYVEVLPLASPYKTQALQLLCETLTSLQTRFPGTNLTMEFSVVPARRLS